MKTSRALLVALLVAASAATAASIDRVVVRQQWPWSTDIRVEYEISGVTSPVDLVVRAWNGNEELDATRLRSAIKGDLYGIASSGVGTLVIDPATAFGTSRVALPDFKVELTTVASPTGMDEVLYKIVNLEPPYDIVDVRRADFLNGHYGNYVTNYTALNSYFSSNLDDVFIWTDITNNLAYKTTHMVFRKIPAAGKSYVMQDGNADVNGGAGVSVSFTNDFYLGVFEVTQAQMSKFSNATHYYKNPLYSATRPADSVYWGTHLRGTSASDGRAWPEGDHLAPESGSFLGAMQNATGLLADLPTEAMWEFAARAGATGNGNYTGNTVGRTQSLILVGCGVNNPSNVNTCKGNPAETYGGENCDLSVGTKTVGSFLPNAYGLYDMMGNVLEFCLDYTSDASDLVGGVDPRGPASARAEQSAGIGYRVLRSSLFFTSSHTINDRDISRFPDSGAGSLGRGFRVCIYTTSHEDGTR